MTTFAPAKNLAYALIDGGITAVATSFNAVSGGSKFPNPAIDGSFSGTIWNVTDYESAHLDPNAEIVTVTARSTNAFTVTRGAESTSAVAHNTTGKTYAIALTFTAGSYDAITTAINARGELSANNVWTGINSFDYLRARSSSGVIIEANNGTDVAIFGAGGSSGATFYGGVNVNGSMNIGTDSSNTHIIRGAVTFAYSSGSTGRLLMTNAGLVMIGASTAPVAGVQLESGNTGSGTPTDYVLIKTSGSVANRGGLLISNQASVSGSTNSLKITNTFNSSTSGSASIGWVDNNATETWVGTNPSMTFAYNTSSPFVRFNHPLQMLAGQAITSSTANNFLNLDNSGNLQLASRSSINNYIDYDNNTTATALYNVIADNTTTLLSIREDGVFTVNYTNSATNVFTITGTTLAGGSSLRVYDNSSDATVRRVIFATNDHASATGCIVAHLQQDSTANALYIDHNENGISINVDGEQTTAICADFVCDALTTGSAIRAYSNSADASSRNLVSIINDNSSASATNALRVQQDANYYALNVQGVGNTTVASMIVQSDALTTGQVAYFYSNSSNASTRSLVIMRNDHASATGATVLELQQDSTGNALTITHAGALATNKDGLLLHCTGANTNGNTSAMYVLQNNVSSTAPAIRVLHTGNGRGLSMVTSNTTDNALDIIASSMTTGRGASIYSNSSSASQFVLLDLISANSSATGMIPLAIANAASVSTNYKIMAYFGGVFLWKSAGVTPNGFLTGTVGDVCIGADSGKIYYCGGGTTWTAA